MVYTVENVGTNINGHASKQRQNSIRMHDEFLMFHTDAQYIAT